MKRVYIITFIVALLLVVAMMFSACLPAQLEQIKENKTKRVAGPTRTTSVTATPEDVPTPIPTYEAASWDEWVKVAEDMLPEYIPLDIIMSFDEYTTPQITSDGSKILYRHTTPAKDAIEIMDLQTGDISNVPWPSGAQGIPHFAITPNANKVLLFIDDRGDENFGIYLADIETGKTKTILPGGDNDCNLVGFNPLDDDECFIAIFDFDWNVFHIYRMHLVDETIELMSTNSGNIVNWTFDTKGRINLLTTMSEDASYHVWLRNDLDDTNPEFVEEEWTNIFTWDYEDTDNSRIIDFNDETGYIVIIDSSIQNASVVASYNIHTKKKTVIDSDKHKTYEPSGLWLDINTREVIGVAYMRERFEWEALENEFQSHLDVLAGVADGDFNLLSSSNDDAYWIVSYDYDVKTTDYYVYNAATKKVRFLYNSNPKMKGYDYAPMEPMQYTASDGLTIHGYATYPVNMKHSALPMVVLVHGGPWARDVWDFDPEVQFLANRGYMVLQVNFRGSTGYGKDFMLAGDMEWSGLMHQDILDAVDWAIDNGYANPERIAIYGASYGGYEALVSATKNSDVFACAVDMFGPSSLLTLVSSQPPQWNAYANNLYRSIGDPAKDEAEMIKRSPLYYVEDISIPLLVVQGGNDVRVTPTESEQVVDAMKQAGLPVDYLFFPNAGHGFSSRADVTTFYQKVEEFLAAYIGGRNGEPEE
ncbi:MAG: S9 family peptidase [Clostridiales bacterium]|nr:S9 family peptidase [Clostridiales bacterium]